ncbi:RNA 2',3'-cyclic phosphodiesterase [Streptomyces sp. NPDC001793]|uniref:RNA 2',3'-cyclic phosphodiesterase n=1 Tax=Streptomyces sp. NPDC001793 TaxID=3154657 RepID=UPI00332D2B6C
MRLFAAVLPPDSSLGQLASVVGHLKQLPDADRLRWTGHDGWHFTLAFYGEVPDEDLPELRERLARAAGRHAPYELRIAGGGRFGDRVVWAGADGDRPAMRHLADAAEAAGCRMGLKMGEHRPYTPHLTLARSRTGHLDLVPYAAALADFAGSPWTVEEMALMRSHPPAPGVPGAQPHYAPVARWPLGG